jgi:rubrerythrin
MFKVDFPEYEKFSSENEMIPSEPNPEPMPDNSPNPDPMPETEETENDLISDPEEAIPFLVKDEEEAIAGYEAAAEVVADSDLENKEEILDTIDHIKEEEEEHIEELNDLVDTKEDTVSEDENDPISNPEEIETLEDATTELEELFDIGLNVGIDGGENNNVSVLSSHEPEKEGEEELKELFDANVNLSLDGGTGNDVSVLSPLGGVGLGEGKKPVKEDYIADLSASISKDFLYNAIVTEGDVMTLIINSEEDADGNTIEQSWEILDADGIFSVVEHYYNVKTTDVVEGDFVFESDDFDTFYARLQREYPEVFIGSEKLTEHVNEEHPAIESDQELEGTDNAVVDCKVADVVTHSEDEKPVDCEGKKKPLEKPLTEDTHAKYAKPEGDRKEAYNNALKYAKKDNVPYIYGYSGINGKFFAFGQPVKVTGDIVEKEKEFRSRYKNCKVVYVAYPDKSFVEGYQTFTPEEMEEYGIDEDGCSIDGYDEYVRCTWCEDIYTKDMCGFEADFGWLCDRCQAAITSRGERLSMIINPTEDDFKRVMTEQVSMTSAELIDKYGTDDIDLINAGKEPEERVELKEEAPEYDLTEVNKLLSEIRGENKKKSIHMR